MLGLWARGRPVGMARKLLAATLPAVALCGLLALLAPSAAYAWGAEGHRIVARLAATQLTPAARHLVATLLELPTEDVDTVSDGLAAVSTWADEVRSPSTAPWHYVNLRRPELAVEAASGPGGATPGCSYDPDLNCIDGLCLVSALRRQARALAGPLPNAERAKALRFLVHLVGDAHQPLHSGFADDRGGNSFQVQAFGRGSNLHAVWDSGLIAAWPGGGAALSTAVGAAPKPDQPQFAPESWVMQSCAIVSAQGFYPDTRRIGADYHERWSTVLRDQLSAAGWRLAWLLNGVAASP